MVNDEYKYYHLPESKAKLETWYAASRNEVWMVVRNGNSYTVTRRAEAVNNNSISEVGAEVVIAAFHKAIQQWINLMPEALRPAGMTAATCKCGCGQPPATKSDYATSACRVRFFRKEKRKQPIPGQLQLAPVADKSSFTPWYKTIIQTENYHFTYGEERPHYGFYKLTIDDNATVHTCTNMTFVEHGILAALMAWWKGGVLDNAAALKLIKHLHGWFKKYPLPVAAPPFTKIANYETAENTIEKAKDKGLKKSLKAYGEKLKAEAEAPQKMEEEILAVLIEKYKRGWRYDYKINILHHTRGYSNTEAWHKAWNNAFNRLKKAGKIIHNNDPTDYQSGLSDTYLASLKQPKVTASDTEAVVSDDNKKRIERIAKRILKALQAGCPNDIVSLDRNCARWGVTPSYGKDIREAYSIVKEDGRLDKVLASLNPPKVTPDPEVDTTIADLEAIIMSVFKKYEYPIMSTFKKALKQLGFDADSKEGKSNIDAAITNLINRGLIKREGLMFTETK